MILGNVPPGSVPHVSDVSLRRLFEANAFPVPDDELVLFGLRGALPEGETGDLGPGHHVALAEPDYVHPRCTVGVWKPGAGEVALFAGTTVPHRTYVTAARKRNGRGANELLPGRYPGYTKGVHRAGSPTAHRALRQTKAQGHRRTVDDVDFDADDRVEVANPYDNFHAMWSMGPDHAYFASAGCQGAVGYPRCPKRERRPAAGPWADLDAIVWGSDQDVFTYHLLPARELLRIADLYVPRVGVTLRLRYGSQGEHVDALQARLALFGRYTGEIDGDYGPKTLRAVLDFQEAEFGESADDGVVGPITAEAMGLDLPRV